MGRGLRRILPPVLAAIAAVPVLAVAPASAKPTHWLCRPGLAENPCLADMTATVVGAAGGTRVEHSRPARRPGVDCFYVYPTVSGQQTVNANLHIDPSEISIAEVQASRFSQACRVYAPMYRQLTLRAIFHPELLTAEAANRAYLGVRQAWRNYLAHYNRGRGVVLIGHSQGTRMLTRLVTEEIDPRPGMRRLLVSALLIGGHVTVAKGRGVGGSFQHVAACRTARQNACVVAYSSYDSEPPPDSLFARAGDPFGQDDGDPDKLDALCVSPPALTGDGEALGAYFSTGGGPTPWVRYPDLYSGRCESADGATWLQIDHSSIPGDTRPIVTPSLGAAWGLHLYDINLALGNLVKLTKLEASAYLSRR
ncbi:MAG: DUF3089 domain-containing protein [Solirubrobacterales bacterium]